MFFETQYILHNGLVVAALQQSDEVTIINDLQIY